MLDAPLGDVTAWPGIVKMSWEQDWSARHLVQVIFSSAYSQVTPRPTEPGPHLPREVVSVCFIGQGPLERCMGWKPAASMCHGLCGGLPDLPVSPLFLSYRLMTASIPLASDSDIHVQL